MASPPGTSAVSLLGTSAACLRAMSAACHGGNVGGIPSGAMSVASLPETSVEFPRRRSGRPLPPERIGCNKGGLGQPVGDRASADRSQASAPAIALATCAQMPDLDEDGPLLIAALDRVGVRRARCGLGRPGSRLGRLRPRRHPDHLGLHLAPRRVLVVGEECAAGRQPADILDWNTDKRYLPTSGCRAGVPVIPDAGLRSVLRTGFPG